MSMRLMDKKWDAARRKARRSLARISDHENAELTQAAAADPDNPIIDERMFASMRPAVEVVPENRACRPATGSYAPPTIPSHSSSLSTATPSSRALPSFEPAPSPATT
jgi:hypothetical protein